MSPRRAEYADATRRDLVAAARELFATRGYAATSLDEVVSRAEVTKGALYHHFENKRELFAAVAERVEIDITARIARGGTAERDPWSALTRGIERYLNACMEPEVQRILLLDAPTVLGWIRWRDLEACYGLGLTTAALEAAMDAGLLERRPTAPIAHVLLGALAEGAIYIAQADDPAAARREVAGVVGAMLNGLRIGGGDRSEPR